MNSSKMTSDRFISRALLVHASQPLKILVGFIRINQQVSVLEGRVDSRCPDGSLRHQLQNSACHCQGKHLAQLMLDHDQLQTLDQLQNAAETQQFGM